MAAGMVTLTVGNGNGGTFTARFWSSDGTITGLLYPAPVLTDTAGLPIVNADGTVTGTPPPGVMNALWDPVSGAARVHRMAAGLTGAALMAMAGDYPSNSGAVAVPLEVGSANAAATNNQTLTNAAGKTTFITGFTVTGGGATAASTIQVTITGLTNTLTFHIGVPVVALGVMITPLIIQFPKPIPASAVNTAIVVNVPSFGAGNLFAAAAAWGYQL